MQGDDPDFDPSDVASVLESCETLAAVGRFVRLIPGLPWFRLAGEALDQETSHIAELYLSALGAPDATPVLAGAWEDAAAAAETRDFNDPAWEWEEQLRAGLTEDALSMMDETALTVALSHVTTITSESAGEGAIETAEYLRIDDEAFLAAATGAAVSAAHNAALVLAAGEDAEHAFAAKFALFERGRWPIGLVGNTFNIF